MISLIISDSENNFQVRTVVDARTTSHEALETVVHATVCTFINTKEELEKYAKKEKT